MIEIRLAQYDDADALCDAHVAGWRVGYRGLFPDDYLDADDFDSARRENWRSRRWLRDAGTTAMFAAALDGRVQGFAQVGAERIDGVPGEFGRGEVWSFYLHPSSWGSGLAAELMTACETWLRERGFAQAILWVLRDNPRARAFYEKAGWSWSGEETTWQGPTMPGVNVPAPIAEVQYTRML